MLNIFSCACWPSVYLLWRRLYELYELFVYSENFYLLLININLNDYLIQLQKNFKYVWKKIGYVNLPFKV